MTGYEAKRSALVLLLVLGTLLSSPAQVGAPDPRSACDAAEARCARLLPLDGRVTVPDGGGGYRTCDCPALLGSTVGQLRALRAARDAVTRQRMLRYLMRPSSIDTAALVRDVVITVHGNGAIERNMGSVKGASVVQCFFMEARAAGIKELVTALNASGGIDVQALHFKLLGTDSDMVFPMIVAGTSSSEPGGNVFIPHRFLADVHVKRELFVFMLLHEIGHTQGVDGAPVSEYDADEWALTEGMAMFAEGSGSEMSEFLTTVPDQLRAYHASQFTASTAGQAVDAGAPLNSYPELNCRIAHLRGEMLQVDEGGSYRDAYPPDCWDDPAMGGALTFGPHYERLSCHPELETFTDELECSACDTVSLLFNARRRLLEQVWTLERFRRPCVLRPDLCKLDPAQVRQRLLAEVPGLARRERAAGRRAERSQRRLQRMADEVLKSRVR